MALRPIIRREATATPVPWVRPADWLPMPAPVAEQLNILVAVWDTSSNFCALSASVSTDGYTVDWGDGNITTHASGATAEHKYTYATVGNPSTLGYRQAILKIYPTTPGSTITALDLGKKHSQAWLNNSYSQPWLDIEINTPSCTSFTIYSTILSRHIWRIVITAMGAFTSGQNQFQNCFSLTSLSLPAGFGSAQTSGHNQFQSCFSLTSLSLPAGFGSAQTSGQNQFYNCTTLTNLTLPAGFGTAQTNGQSQFQNCYAVDNLTLPAGFGTAQTNGANQFYQCYSLTYFSLPVGFGSVQTGGNAQFQYCHSLARMTNYATPVAFSLDAESFGTTELEEVFDYLNKASGAQTVTITDNWGAPTPISLTGGTTSGSATVTMASTAGLTTGMEISGTGISSAVAVTMQDTGDTVTRTAHGLPNGKRVAFASIVSTTGIATYTPYYVINATADTFQLSLTEGGAAIALTTDGSGTLIYGTLITAINPNVSITLDVPASATGSPTTSSAVLKRSIARLKGWTVVG